MEISLYLRIVRRWLWLIVLGAAIAGSVSFVTARDQPARYQAKTVIQIGTAIGLTNPNSNMISDSMALGYTYIELIKTTPVLEAVIKAAQLNISPGTLSGLFSVSQVNNTPLLEINVFYNDPIVAADLANKLAEQLIANSPTQLAKEQQAQIQTLQDEIAAAQATLKADRDEMKTIDDNLTTVSAADRALLTQRRIELSTEINSVQNNFAQLNGTLVSLQESGTINSLRIVQRSTIPTYSITPGPVTNTIAGIGGGAILAACVAFLIEYLNNTLRSPSEVTTLLKVSLLGSIPAFGNKRSYSNKLVTWSQPRSSVSEAYRALRINILFRETSSEATPDCRFYLVTSAGPSEGKSVTISNLAVTFAMTGMRVLLIDADLRRPSIHNLFGLTNDRGLSDISAKPADARSRPHGATTIPIYEPTTTETLVDKIRRTLVHIVQKTEIPNLDVITAGTSVNNPADLLDSPQLHELIHQLSATRNYDVVFIDTPPTLVVTDSSIIANSTGAKAIVVFEAGRTHRGGALRTIDHLNSLAIPIVGVILNRLKARDRDAYYSYDYYYGYSRYGETNQMLLPKEKGSSPNGKNNDTNKPHPAPVGTDQQN